MIAILTLFAGFAIGVVFSLMVAAITATIISQARQEAELDQLRRWEEDNPPRVRAEYENNPDLGDASRGGVG